MEIDRLRSLLDNGSEVNDWFTSANVANASAGHANLLGLATCGVTLDLLAILCDQFESVAPTLADPDMALNNLERFVRTSRSPMAMLALFERDRQALPNLLQIFSASQYLSELLIHDFDAYDHLRMTEGRPASRALLVEELMSDVRALGNREDVQMALRRFKRRETMRIAYGDIVRGQSVATVARQISFVADAILEAAIEFARSTLEEEYGRPIGSGDQPSRFTVLALGKLGGVELNYSSDIDLIFVYESDGQTEGPRTFTNREFFERLCRDVVRMLTEPTELGTAYRIDLRLRPEGSRGQICDSMDRFLRYYDLKGRTWERQAYVKARAAAGDLDFGNDLLAHLEPWIYRRYLSLADITGIQTLKRQIERHTHREGTDLRDVKTGLGGIRDIEFVIQFLQLLNGGTLPEVRTGNTLEGIARLEQAGCLTHQERTILEDNYAMLRKLEHRLQMMYDLQTHMMPEDRDELRKLAIRLGYHDTAKQSALAAFEHDFKQRTDLNRKILDHLLHDAFDGEEAAEPEVDLVNDPNPPPDEIQAVLGRYPFEDVQTAYQNLMALATERITFLSPRRCRHFLAAIAPRLLAAIAETPEPDTTLVNLSRVSDSLGGKAALWELFSTNRPSLNLYVTLCAACPYLSSILTSNPGMIDELLDSLLVDQLPTLDVLTETLAELCRGAEDTDPILHSFKNAQHLRVGVRDVLGKDDIRSTHASLADIAQACVMQITRQEYDKLVKKFGRPTIGELPDGDDATARNGVLRQRFAEREGDVCEFVVLAMGKLGGREPNYHSDLDLIFLYEADGQTATRHRDSQQTTTNGHFFSELGQRIIKAANYLGPHGRLYEVDARLRPTGRSGSLAVPIEGFARYFAGGSAQLWERQALCKARVIWGTDRASQYAMEAVVEAVYGPPWQPAFAREIREMRLRLEETASRRNLKRGPGGTVDTEFLVQMLQLKCGGKDPSVRVQGTLDALVALEKGGYLDTGDAEYLRHSYRFQRSIEARIRLMNAVGRHEVPENPKELAKLAFLLGYADTDDLTCEVEEIFRENRNRFNRQFDEVERD